MTMIRAVAVALCLAALFALQVFLYVGFVQREVAWNYALHGDPTWYLAFCYRLFEAMMNGDWGVVGRFAKNSPWGVPLFLEAGLNQLVFGRGRLGIVSINLVYFLVAQLATFAFFTWVARSVWGGILAVLLLLAMQTPFRGDGVGLNIADFHFDLVFFYLLLGILYLVGRSDTFALRGWSIAVSVLAALTVATRLVSVFLLVGVFGVVFLWLAWRWWREVPNRLVARTRLVNIAVAGLAFSALAAVPVVVARKALYNHYFRFVFDREFSDAKTSLYSMGDTKLVEAWQLVRRMVAYDFGWPFLGALILLLAAVGMRRWLAGDRLMHPDRDARQTFIGFLLIAAVVSYVMHLIFPIQSDHLTRITAAPIFVLLIFLAVRPTVAALRDVAVRPRLAAALLVVGMGAVAAFVQLSFYAGTGRYADRRMELAQISDLYADISRVAQARAMHGVSLSVDQVRTFELGAMMSFVSYEYETHGRLIEPAARLGDKIDQPIAWSDAVTEIDQSDFVLLQSSPYRNDLAWPMMKSIASFHDDLVSHVRQNFCLVSRYVIAGVPRELYARPQHWNVTSSGRKGRRTGPERLLAGGQQTWTVRWRSGAEQWVEFESAMPVALASFGIQVTKKKRAQGPADFRLDALGDNGATQLLSVTGAQLDDEGRRIWTIQEPVSARRYRLTVTATQGDPDWLSIQKIWTTSRSLNCEIGQPWG